MFKVLHLKIWSNSDIYDNNAMHDHKKLDNLITSVVPVNLYYM